MVFEKNLNCDQVDELMLHPLSFVATDGGGFSLNTANRLVHPRCFGAASKFLRDITSSGRLTLEQAIKKLTSGPAKKIGFKKRGEIKIGNFADLVLFDPTKIKDNATYENPFQYSTGMDYVFVNGKVVVQDGKPTGNLPGYVLRKS
jgi:N-acyl-D-aspartate/D-glutamate deacylase